MSDIAISVQNLSKRYRLGLKEKVPDTFVGALTSWLKSPLANYRQLHKLSDFRDDPLDQEGHELGRTPEDVLYALRDVSFDIRKGEVVGIIGRNGAGKSTLLKILSRITEPTSGRVEVHGRVASLLEVGTGFHPELTGRENIYLNGTILGMRKAEIDRKFDEIVAFSEVEKFLDTPVKRYSSGMYVRLAFAVAAHLEPEILIVDEVLAVGDAAFQKKCLGKMQDVSKNEGRTVLVVSHSMTAIQALATQAVLMESGRTAGVERVASAVGKYLFGETGTHTGEFRNRHIKPASPVDILSARLVDAAGVPSARFPTCEPISLEITWINRDGVCVNPNFQLNNRQGVTVMVASDAPVDWSGGKKAKPGTYVSRVTIPPNLLNANDYTLHLALDASSPRVAYGGHLDALGFTVWDPMDHRCLARGNFTSLRDDAVLWPALDWSWRREDSMAAVSATSANMAK